MCLRGHNPLIYMCVCIQFWFVKNQTVVQNAHYNHVLHKKTFTLKNYTKSIHSCHVTHTLLRHKYTFLPCYTYTLTTQVYILVMLHIHSYDTSIHSCHVTHTQSRETNLQSYYVTHPK